VYCIVFSVLPMMVAVGDGNDVDSVEVTTFSDVIDSVLD
jgi:hypothetical protein